MERFVWEVMDKLEHKRVAVVVGGRVRWEEWFEALAAPAAGRDSEGFAPKGRLKGDPRPSKITCVLCHEDYQVKPRGKVPMICSGCRSEGLFPGMARD